MLEITSDDIAALNDDDLRSLVGLLCESELRSRCLSRSAVTWGGDQNAPDGGVDVRISLPPEQPMDGFLPRPNIGFQVKKTDFTPGLIGPEMRPKGELRPSIRSLIAVRGVYIIVSSGSDASDSALTDRITAMRNAVIDADPFGHLHLDFYDRSRLATWVRNHPGLIVWVRKRIGRAIAGWRPYESWAYSPNGVKDEYLTDNKARLHAGTRDEHSLSVSDGIKRIREVLGNAQGVVRLAGLSGVGKTRLVQALFDERIAGGSLDPALVVYTDMSDNPDPQPTGMAHDLIAARTRAIVVVDNCAPDLHRRLTELCRAVDSTLSAITIEYDIRDDEPEGTEVFRLEPSSPQIVGDLVERRFPNISKVDANTISNFSGGNARIAIALASTLNRNETLAGLKDEELFKRLFDQRQNPDGQLLAAAQACALLYSFQGVALTDDAAELPILASLIETTPQDLFAKVAELKQRDLVQKRGEWRAILPHAIANRLAVMALRRIPLELMEIHFSTERLMRSFSRRLGYLHESEEAVRVVTKWLGTDGLLSNVATLNELGVAMFNNVAPVTPRATLVAIECALAGSDAASITQNSVRRDRIARLLRTLAYDEALFERCVAALLILADAETAEVRSHPVQDALKGLFYLYLSGTHATVEQRLNAIEPLLRSRDARKRALGMILLGAMLEANHFSSGHAFEFGARPRDYGFWPKTLHDDRQWYLAILAMLKPLATSELEVSAAVRSKIAEAIRGLWRKGPELQVVLEELTKDILTQRYWQQGWIAVRTVLSHPGKNTQEYLTRLRALEKTLRPKNVAEQVHAIVLSRSGGRLDYADIDEDDENTDKSQKASYERANSAAHELGTEVARDRALFIMLLPDLVRGERGRLRNFGMGIALASPERHYVWDKLTEALGSTPKDEQNIEAFTGFLMGVHTDEAIFAETLLDDALEHPVLALWFPLLQASVPVSQKGTERLRRAAMLGKAHVWQFNFLGWERPGDAISKAELRELLRVIAKREHGYAVATDILSMRFQFDRDEKTAHSPELIEMGRELLAQVQFDDRDQMHDYRLRMIVNACLSSDDGKEAARFLCEKIKAGIADYSVYVFHYDQLIEGLFKVQPRIALDVFFGVGADGTDVVDSDAFDDPSDHRRNPLDAVSDDEIIYWCKQSPTSRFVAIANAVRFFASTKDAPLEWSPIALRILNEAPDPVAALDVFIERFSPGSWSGSRAAIIESRARLLDALANHPNPALVARAREKRPELQDAIAKTREWENKHDREQDERFE